MGVSLWCSASIGLFILANVGHFVFKTVDTDYGVLQGRAFWALFCFLYTCIPVCNIISNDESITSGYNKPTKVLRMANLVGICSKKLISFKATFTFIFFAIYLFMELSCDPSMEILE